MAKEGLRKGDLEEVLIASRATDEDLEAGLLSSTSYAVDSQGNPVQAPQQRSSVKRNVSELGQRVRMSFNGQSDTPTPPPLLAPVLANPSTSNHPPLPKSAMKKAGEQTVQGHRHSPALPEQPCCTHVTLVSSGLLDGGVTHLPVHKGFVPCRLSTGKHQQPWKLCDSRYGARHIRACCGQHSRCAFPA